MPPAARAIVSGDMSRIAELEMLARNLRPDDLRARVRVQQLVADVHTELKDTKLELARERRLVEQLTCELERLQAGQQEQEAVTRDVPDQTLASVGSPLASA